VVRQNVEWNGICRVRGEALAPTCVSIVMAQLLIYCSAVQDIVKNTYTYRNEKKDINHYNGVGLTELAPLIFYRADTNACRLI